MAAQRSDMLLFSMRSAMRIFFFVDYWPMPLGGMETHARAYIKHIQTHTAHDIEVIGFSDNPHQNTSVAGAPYKLTVLPKHAIHMPDMPVRVLRAKRFSAAHDVLFFNSIYWIETFTALKRAFPEGRITLRSGGNDIMQAQVHSRGATCAQRRAYIVRTVNACVDVLIVNSAFVRKRFRRLGIARNIMHLSRGGVDTERFRPLHNRRQRERLRALLGAPCADCRILLSVCRLVPFKGLNVLLAARAHLSPRDQYLHIIAGDGPERAALRRRTAQLGLAGTTRFIGSIDTAAVHLLYQAADVYAHTPLRKRVSVPGGSYIHTETMGRSFCEALATGVPVVATSVGGVPEVVTHGVNGILARAGDVHGVARALRLLASSPHIRKTMAQNALVQRTRISWRTLFNAYEPIICISG